MISLDTNKRATADEEDSLCVDLDVFLLWVFASTLGWNVADGAFENF